MTTGSKPFEEEFLRLLLASFTKNLTLLLLEEARWILLHASMRQNEVLAAVRDEQLPLSFSLGEFFSKLIGEFKARSQL